MTPDQPSRQKILEAAAKVYCACGFRGATTRRIAEAAGVNEVTLFRHFGSKQQLLAEAIGTLDPMAEVHLPGLPSNPQAELSEWCRGHLDAMRSRRDMIRKTMAEMAELEGVCANVAEHRKPQFTELVEYTCKLRPPATRAERTEIATACSMLFGALFSDAMGRDVVPSLFPVAEEHAAAAYVRLFLQSLGIAEHGATGVTNRGQRKHAV
ncbi:MAG: TetR/AcrR family transcriptional regulator [Gemmatimonadota bacterium]